MRKNIIQYFKDATIARYILDTILKWTVTLLFISSIIFAILYFTGAYATLQRVLDLKYNSPFIILPIILSSFLAILSFVIACLLYFHKYKRPKYNSKFKKMFLIALNKEKFNMDTGSLMEKSESVK